MNNKPRNFRSAETSTLLKQLRASLGTALQQPAISPGGTVHHCRQITFEKWQVRFFIGGHIRALGQYPFETAVRLQDVLTFHFSSYRQSASYNTSEQEARELLGKHLFLQAFASALETHWLNTGVLRVPGVDKTEERWKAIESQVAVLNSEIAALRQLIEKAS